MKEEILEFLQEAKHAYENRLEDTDLGLCSYIYLYNELSDKSYSVIKNKIENLVFKSTGNINSFFRNIPSEASSFFEINKNKNQLHYTTRLELIDLLIKYFSEEFQGENTNQTC